MKFVILLLSILTHSVLIANKHSPKYIFKNHKEGYGVYRIPAIIKINSGKLLAFCEGRQSLFDHGNIDLVMKTSTDNGATWSSLKVIWNFDNNTCGNPAPVFDKATGDVIVVATLNNDKVYVLKSKDEGSSWETPAEITASVKKENWKWYATGPVHAIQLAQAEHKNRIVIPCNHTETGSDIHQSHVIFSDDNGLSWKLGGIVPTRKTDECTVAELSNGDLILNMRNNDRELPNRKISISKDGGEQWTEAVYDSTLIEPVCQGSLLRYADTSNLLLFSNPAHPKKRKNLMLRVSNDSGNSWQKVIEIHKGKSAYNDMVVLNNGNIFCLFETGKILPYSGIAMKVIIREAITSR